MSKLWDKASHEKQRNMKTRHKDSHMATWEHVPNCYQLRRCTGAKCNSFGETILHEIERIEYKPKQ